MIQHPFLITLSDSWKDSSFLYLLFPYICGGELFSYLRNAGRLVNFRRYDSMSFTRNKVLSLIGAKKTLVVRYHTCLVSVSVQQMF